NALSAAFSSKFTTGNSMDGSGPAAPTITSPGAETWTTSSTFTIVGNNSASDPNALMKVYVDNAPFGSMGGEDALSVSEQLTGDLTNFSINVTLTSGTANRFLVTATDAAGNQSAAAVVPIIHQGDSKTTPGTIHVTAGTTTIQVVAPLNGDSNGNNSAKVRWR